MPISIPNSKVFVPTLVMLSLFLAACAASPTQTPSPSPTSVSVVSPSTTLQASPAADVSAPPVITTEADGTRTITDSVHYNNPAGGDDVAFKLVVAKDGTITNASAEVKAIHDTSIKLQTNFAAALKGEVVGKKLSGLEVDRIGGASLTTGAFNEFLTEINT